MLFILRETNCYILYANQIKSGSVRVPSILSEVRFVLSNFYSDLETSRKKKRCSIFFFKKECINNNNILLIKTASAFPLIFIT